MSSFLLLRDVLLRDCDSTYFGPAILQYVKAGIGNDGKTRNTFFFCKLAKSGGDICIYIDLYMKNMYSCIYLYILVYI